MKKSSVFIPIVVLLLTCLLACGTAEKSDKKNQPADASRSVQIAESPRVFNPSDIGEVMGKDGTAIFFYTKVVDRDTLRKVADYYKKLAIKNRDKNVFINFFDAKPTGENWKYPMSDVLTKHWFAEYVYSSRTNRDELRFIER